jgi:hypothetical protein
MHKLLILSRPKDPLHLTILHIELLGIWKQIFQVKILKNIKSHLSLSASIADSSRYDFSIDQSTYLLINKIKNAVPRTRKM